MIVDEYGAAFELAGNDMYALELPPTKFPLKKTVEAKSVDGV
jgi:hypothetical protein